MLQINLNSYNATTSLFKKSVFEYKEKFNSKLCKIPTKMLMFILCFETRSPKIYMQLLIHQYRYSLMTKNFFQLFEKSLDIFHICMKPTLYKKKSKNFSLDCFNKKTAWKFKPIIFFLYSCSYFSKWKNWLCIKAYFINVLFKLCLLG